MLYWVLLNMCKKISQTFVDADFMYSSFVEPLDHKSTHQIVAALQATLLNPAYRNTVSILD